MRAAGRIAAGLLVAVVALPAAAASAAPGDPGCVIRRAYLEGATGKDVSCIEQALAAEGFLTAYVDDYFGVATTTAVKDYERANGLTVDGVVDARVATSLGIWSATPEPASRVISTRVIGYSVQGRPIIAYRLGTPGGKVVVGVGNIHGDEHGGLQIAEYLRTSVVVPDGIDMWIIDTVNPDGLVLDTRPNAKGVDLNRNFPTNDWVRVGAGTEKYSGTSPGSEPETQATARFLQRVEPALVVWWHQAGRFVDDQRTVANYALLRDYSRLTGYGIKYVGCGSTPCVGNATVFVNTAVAGATSFVVELPPSFGAATVQRHAAAFLAIAEKA